MRKSNHMKALLIAGASALALSGAAQAAEETANADAPARRRSCMEVSGQGRGKSTGSVASIGRFARTIGRFARNRLTLLPRNTAILTRLSAQQGEAGDPEVPLRQGDRHFASQRERGY